MSPSKWCLRHSSGGFWWCFASLPERQLTSHQHLHHVKKMLLHEEIQLVVFSAARISFFFHLMKHSACFICRHNYLIVCLSLFVCLFVSFFSSRNQNQRTGILLEDLFWDCGHWLSWFFSRHMESNTWSTSSEFEQAGWLHWLPLWIHWCHPSCLYVYYGCSEKQSWHLSSKCCCDVMSSAPYSEV